MEPRVLSPLGPRGAAAEVEDGRQAGPPRLCSGLQVLGTYAIPSPGLCRADWAAPAGPASLEIPLPLRASSSGLGKLPVGDQEAREKPPGQGCGPGGHGPCRDGDVPGAGQEAWGRRKLPVAHADAPAHRRDHRRVAGRSSRHLLTLGTTSSPITEMEKMLPGQTSGRGLVFPRRGPQLYIQSERGD